MQAIKSNKEPVIVFIRRDAADKLRELAKSGNLSKSQKSQMIKFNDPDLKSSSLEKAIDWLKSNQKEGVAPSLNEFIKFHKDFYAALKRGVFPENGKRYSEFVVSIGLKTKGKGEAEIIKWDDESVKIRELAIIKEWLISNSKSGIAPSIREFIKKHYRFCGALTRGNFPDIGKNYKDLVTYFGLSPLRQINRSERKMVEWKDSGVRNRELEKAKDALLKNSKEGIAPSRRKFIQIVGESFVWALKKGYFPELGAKYVSFAEFYGLSVKRKSIDRSATIKWNNPNVREKYLSELKGWMISNSVTGIAPSIEEFKKNHDWRILNALQLGSFPEIGKNYSNLVTFFGLKTKGTPKSETGNWKNKEFRDKELEKVRNWMISNSKNGTCPSQKKFAKQNLRFVGALQLGIFPEIGTKYTDLVRFVGLKQLKNKWMDKETKEKILEEAKEWIVKNSVDGISPNRKEFITGFGLSLLDALHNRHFPLIGRGYNDLLKHYGLGLPDERNRVVPNKFGQWKNINFRNKQLEITKAWLNKNAVNGIAPISKEFKNANGPISNALSAGYFPEIGTNYGDLLRFLGLRLKSSTLYIDWKDQDERNAVLLAAKEWLIDNSKNGIAPSMKIFLKERGNALINALWVGHYPDIGNNYSNLVSYAGLKTIRQPRITKNNRINWKDDTEKISELRKAQKWIIDNSTDGIAPSVRSFVKEKNAFYQALRNKKFPEIGNTYDSFIKNLGLQNKERKRISVVKELARSF